MTVGNTSTSGVQGAFSTSNATSLELLCSLPNTLLGNKEDILK